MAEETDAPRETAIRASLIEPLGKWIALFGSLIAVGQAGTSWITGYWHSKAEEASAEQALKLADLKERSALASEYLKLIISRDTALPERVTLLDALGSIDRHPLQQWARERYAVYKEALARSEAAFRAQQEAAQAKEGAEKDEATLRAEIDKLNADLVLAADDQAQREELHTKIIARSEELSRVRGRLTVAVIRYEATRTTVAQIQQPLIAPPAPPPSDASAATPRRPVAYGNGGDLADAITSISQKVTAGFLARYFPASPKTTANIEAAVPYLQAALQEFQVADKRMVAAIIATVVVETPRFEAYEEPLDLAQKSAAGLSGQQAEDRVRFRGRGYLGLTGRSNYAAMSSRLGLGTRLVDSPDDAKSPEVATRILVAWLVEPQRGVAAALATENLAAIRKAVASSPTSQLERFTEAYRKVLADL